LDDFDDKAAKIISAIEGGSADSTPVQLSKGKFWGYVIGAILTALATNGGWEAFKDSWGSNMVSRWEAKLHSSP